MANKKSRKRELAAQAVTANPDAPRRTVARHLRAAHPNTFPTVESARDAVRAVLGLKGQKDKTKRYKHLHRPGRKPGEGCVPRGEGNYAHTRPILLPHKNILALGDLQIPWHDEVAVPAGLEWGRDRKVDAVVLGGDYMDCASISTFLNDPDQRDLDWEFFRGREMLEYIRSIFKRTPIYFMHGNHEERLQRYVWQRADALRNVDALSISSLLDFEKYKVQEIRPRKVVQAGNLRIMHGHEMGGGSVKQPAKWMWMNARENSLFFHFHRHDYYGSPSPVTGEHDCTCWAVGCMCFLRPEWRTMNTWVHGAARIEVKNPNDPKSKFRVEHVRIIDGEVE